MTEIKMLTIKEAGKLIPGLTEYRLRTMCITGEIPVIKAGRKYLINEAVLYKYVNGELSQPALNNEIKPQIKRIEL